MRKSRQATNSRHVERPPAAARQIVDTVAQSDRDRAVAYHEAGHAVVARALGLEVQTITIIPNPNAGWDGACLSDDEPDQFLISEFVKLIAQRSAAARSLVPLGVNRADAGAGTYLIGALAHAIFDVAGPLAEQRATGDAYDDAGSRADYKNARNRAGAICYTDEAVDDFLQYAKAEARGLLDRYWDAVTALAATLLAEKIIKGQLVVDQIILKAIVERDRREQREYQRQMVESAARLYGQV